MITEVLVLNTTTIAPTTCKEISRASKETAEVATTTNAEVAAAANLGVEAEAGVMEITTRTTTLVTATFSTKPAVCPCLNQCWCHSNNNFSTFLCRKSITLCWKPYKMLMTAELSLVMPFTLRSSMCSGVTRRLLASSQVWSSMKTPSTLHYCSRTSTIWTSLSAMLSTCSSLSPPLSELDWLIGKDGVSRSQFKFLACEIVWLAAEWATRVRLFEPKSRPNLRQDWICLRDRRNTERSVLATQS